MMFLVLIFFLLLFMIKRESNLLTFPFYPSPPLKKDAYKQLVRKTLEVYEVSGTEEEDTRTDPMGLFSLHRKLLLLSCHPALLEAKLTGNQQVAGTDAPGKSL